MNKGIIVLSLIVIVVAIVMTGCVENVNIKEDDTKEFQDFYDKVVASQNSSSVYNSVFRTAEKRVNGTDTIFVVGIIESEEVERINKGGLIQRFIYSFHFVDGEEYKICNKISGYSTVSPTGLRMRQIGDIFEVKQIIS